MFGLRRRKSAEPKGRIVELGPGDGCVVFRSRGGVDVEYPLLNPTDVGKPDVLGKVVLTALLWSERAGSVRDYLWRSVLPEVLADGFREGDEDEREPV